MKRLILLSLLLVLPLVSCEKEEENGGGGETTREVTVTGCVKGDDNSPIAGVTVSDGVWCAQTDAEGNYALPADLAKADYVFVSTPSGWAAPVEDGHAIFWKWLKNYKKGADGKYTGVDFKLNKVADPEHYSILIFADPQPRKSNSGVDQYAYHVLNVCDDMYLDMKEYLQTRSGRTFYGICLGDVVHQDVSLLANYRKGMGSLKDGSGKALISNYNVIGNHDQEHKKGMTDETSCKAFEAVMGPVNYSFNLGGIHYLMLDDMMVQEGKYSDECATGLTDDIWQFVQNDLALVPRTTPLVVCAHSPMCRRIDGTDCPGKHLSELRGLLATYPKAYVFAGHTHSNFHYVDKKNDKVETHTLSRVTGALWTNEFLSENGTPRGYVIFDYDNGEVKWKFKPMYYQKNATHIGSYKPDYNWRDWDYDASGKAVLKERLGGGALTEAYQMQVFPPGTYEANDQTVYANIFLWDELWGTPSFKLDAGIPAVMTRITEKNGNLFRYSYADWDICAFYAGKFTNLNKEWYTWEKDSNGSAVKFLSSDNKKQNCASIFKVKLNTTEVHGAGTVTVKDRFNNTYSSHITW